MNVGSPMSGELHVEVNSKIETGVDRGYKYMFYIYIYILLCFIKKCFAICKQNDDVRHEEFCKPYSQKLQGVHTGRFPRIWQNTIEEIRSSIFA